MNLIATSHKYRKKVEDENSSTHSKKMLETMCTIMKKICCGLSCSKNYTDDFTEPVHVQESTQEDKRLLLLNSTDTLNKATAISLDEPETVNYYDTTKYSDFKSASGSAKEAGSFRSIIATTAEENLLSSRQVEQNDNTVKKIVDENGERMKVSSTTQLFQSNGDVSVVMPPVGTSIAFEGFAQTEIHFSGEAKITSDDKKLAETQEGKFGIKDCSCGKQVNLIGVHMRTDEAVNSCLGLCQYAAGFTQNFDEDNTAAKYVLPGQNFPENQGEIGQVILPDPSFSADETEVKKLAQHFDVQDENSVVATEYSLCTFTLEKDSKTFTSSDINSKPKPTCSDTFKIKMRTDLPETKCEKSHELSQLNATGKERNSKTVEYSEVIWFCNQKETGNLCRPEIGDSESDIRLDYYERISDSNCVTYECNFDALAGADSIYEAALRDRTDEKDNRLFGYIQGNEIIKSEMSKSVCRTACKQKFFQKLFDNFIKDMNGEFSTLQEQKEKVSITNENAREFLSEDIQEDFNLNRIAFQETSIKNDINTVVNKKSITAEKKMLTHRKEMTRHRQETSVLEVDSVDNGHYLYPSVQTVENRNGMLECSIYCKHRKSTLPNEELSYSLVDSGLGSLSASRKNSSSFINKGNTSFTDLYLELDVHKHGTYVSKELQTRKNVKRRKGGFKICRQIVKKKSMIKKMKKYLNQYLANAGRRLAKSIAREIHIEPRSYLVFVLGPPYFDIINNGPPPPLQERMRYEWFRLATFHNYTGNGNSLALAGNGFWHDHTRGPTSTRCYLCDACHSSLEMFDDINAEHRRQSPNCPFHENSGQEPVNIPISSGYNEGGASVQTRTSGSTVTAAYTSVTASSFIRSSDAAVNETIRSLQSGQALSSAGENVPQQRTEDPESRDFPLSEQHTQQALRHTGLACSNVTGSAGNDIGQQNSASIATEALQQDNVPPSAPEEQESDPGTSVGGRTDPTITVVVSNPKHPDYVSIDSRVSSYQGWPDYLDQTPRQMSEAGFFFVGVADFTRCFCCGGGLRNWEPGDDPMLEHTRWFPHCEYVSKLKGERYVAAVQRRHQEHMLEQQRQQTEIAQRRDELGIRPPPTSASIATSVLSTCTPSSIVYTGTNVPSSVVYTGTSIGASVVNTTSSTSTATSIVNAGTTTSTVSSASTSATARVQKSGTSASATAEGSSSETENQQTVPGNSSSFNAASGAYVERQSGASGGDGNESRSAAAQCTYLIEKENEELKERLTCKICLERPINRTFLPCGHLVSCETCAPRLKRCPICRKRITGKVKTFMY